tara:strand:- start:8105 stop:9550 length:1446 start_codon:yes stop_codon:yes gene_type:complete
MNSSKGTKKKFSEYELEDVKALFLELYKKISSKIILLEIGNNFLNFGIAKSHNNKLNIKNIFRQELPEEALDKSIPTDPNSIGDFIKQIINEQKINTNKVAICLPSDACYTRLIDIPEEVSEDESTSFLESYNSGIQIPISLENSDFEINLTNLPKKKSNNKIFNKYFLTSIPKKNIDIILDSIKNANLEICSLQMSHMCIANLLKSEIDKLNENELIISVDLLDQFSQLIIFNSYGPLLIKRLTSIRNYPSIEDMKKLNEIKTKRNKNTNNQKNSDIYHALSKLDLKVLIREINDTFQQFLKANNLNNKASIFLSGRNSQHKNLVEIIGKNLKMDVRVISPKNNFCIKEFSYNPDEINQFSMSRLVGLGLTLIKDNELEDESLNKEFIVKSFSYQEEINTKITEKELAENTNLEKKQSKEKFERLSKFKENKKELPNNPNIKTKEKDKSENKNSKDNKDNDPNVKKDKSFKMNASFLKND